MVKNVWILTGIPLTGIPVDAKEKRVVIDMLTDYSQLDPTIADVKLEELDLEYYPDDFKDVILQKVFVQFNFTDEYLLNLQISPAYPDHIQRKN